MKAEQLLGSFFSKNWFLLGILGALICGYFFSSIGSRLNPCSAATTILVIFIFFNTGFTLPTEKIARGIANIKLHIFLQCFIFCAVPLYFFLMSFVFNSLFSSEVLAGIFALSCIPTTISSCIVFTQNAEGNVAGTMFNAGLANILGIFISPLILSLLLRSGHTAAIEVSEMGRILLGLGMKMLLPLGAGQFVRRFFTDYADSRKKVFSKLNSTAILFIIFFAFSKAASHEGFLSLLADLPWPFVFLAVSHGILLLIAYTAARVFRFPKADQISVIFTAPQKTLAMGLPLMTAYFAAQPEILGIGILPLIFYHSWQLLFAGVLLRFLKNRKLSR